MGQTKLGRYCEQAKRWFLKLKTAVESQKDLNYPKCVPILQKQERGQMKKFPVPLKDPNSRLRQARRRWKC